MVIISRNVVVFSKKSGSQWMRLIANFRTPLSDQFLQSPPFSSCLEMRGTAINAFGLHFLIKGLSFEYYFLTSN